MPLSGMTSLDSFTVRESSLIWSRSRLSGHWSNLYVSWLYLIVVSGGRDLSFSISWTGERLDVTVHLLLSRVAGGSTFSSKMGVRPLTLSSKHDFIE